MNEWFELLLCLIALSLFVNWKYETNYLLQTFLLLMVIWCGVLTIINAPDFTVYGITLICFNTMLNLMYLGNHLKSQK